MPLQGTYEPSAWQPVADQVQTYEQTDGREGAELEGKPCVILWTRGRQSGAVRKNPLMRVRHGQQYAVVASMGGAPKHPVWYLNLVADPAVSLQDGDAGGEGRVVAAGHRGVARVRRLPAEHRSRDPSRRARSGRSLTLPSAGLRKVAT